MQQFLKSQSKNGLYRYGNPEVDGQWWHWDHEYLANWDKTDTNKYPTGVHRPPEDIGANFYPHLGAYSSRSEEVIRQHMDWIRQVGYPRTVPGTGTCRGFGVGR